MLTGKYSRHLALTWLAVLPSLWAFAESNPGSAFGGLSAAKPAAVPAPDPYLTVGQVRSKLGTCTGTLISPHVVLTAAHCVFGVPAHDVKFTLDRNPFWTDGTRLATALEVKTHPQYRREIFPQLGPNELKVNDFALVFLESTNYGEPPSAYLPLNSGQSLWRGRALLAPGYGRNANGSHGQFRVATLDVLTLFAPGNFISMSLRPGEQVVCKGDSGGPLLAETNGSFELVGVASIVRFKNKPKKNDFCQSATTALYGDISPHKGWILGHATWMPPARGAASVPGIKDSKSSW